MSVLPSLQDNSTVLQLERLASAIPSNFPVKLDGSLSQAVATLTNVGSQLSSVSKALSSATNVVSLSGQDVTSRIAQAQQLATQAALVSAQTGGLSALANTQSVSFTALPNPLNDYVTYTYHIRWFMTSEAESYNVDESAPSSTGMNMIIIAESGVTAAFNITELKMNGSAGAGAKTRNLWTTNNYEMTLVEPLGVSLMDKILAASKQLGVKDSSKCPFFLEIWFNGYDEDGLIMSPRQFYQLYRVQINNINMTTTAAGTTYNIQFYDDGKRGESDANATPPVGVKITATTLGDFFRQFEQFWNKASADINNDKIARITYKIDFPQPWAAWTLKNPAVAQQTARNAGFASVIDDASTTITIERGQSIENIINYVVYLCQDVQKWIVGEDAPGSGQASTKQHGLIRYVSIRAADRITGWDTLTKSYTHEITYYIFGTESVKAYTDMETVNQVLSEGTQAQKLAYLTANGRLKKRYEWIYTGRNTEVINFDFSVQAAWQMALTAYNQVNNYNQLTQGGTVAQNSVGYLGTRGLLNKTQNAVPANVQNPANTQQAGQQLPPTTQIISQNGPATPLTASQTQQAAALARGGAPNTQSPGQLAADAAKAKGVTNGTLGVNPIQSLSQSSGARAKIYAESITKSGFSEPQPFLLSAMFTPEPQYQQAGQSADQNKIAAQTDPAAQQPGTGFVGTVLGNLFNPTAFGSITLTVRGDPWWIPPSNISQNQVAKSLVGNAGGAQPPPSTNAATAQYLSGDNLFLFTFRPGIRISEETGLATNDGEPEEWFTGLYVVQSVINSFSHGQFSQTITAAKDVLAASVEKDISARVGPGHA